jgi:uncharacterized lipoprotein YehR (DUF1307 family)
MKKILSLLLIFSVSLMVASAGVLRVSSAGDNSDGSSWEKAFNTIQAAMAVAQKGDEVWVAQGEYVISYHAQQLRFMEGVNFYGGFAGTETSKDQRSLNPALTVVSHNENFADTINFRLLNSVDLNEASLYDGFTFDGKGVGMGVRISGNCTLNNAIVKNCVVTNGSGAGVIMIAGGPFVPVVLSNSDVLDNTLKVSSTNTALLGGAGIFAHNNAKMASVINCNIKNNKIQGISATGTLEAKGAGMMLYSGEIKNCHFDNNHVVNTENAAYTNNNFTGGAIAIVPQSVDLTANNVLIEGCVISNSSSPSRGGAIIIDPRWSGQYHGNYTISKSIITNNKTPNVGGAIMAAVPVAQTGAGITLNIENSIISNNSADTGGGLYMFTSAILNITNTNFVNNKGIRFGGGGIFFFDRNNTSWNHIINATFKNVVLWGNESNSNHQLRNSNQHTTMIFSAMQDYDPAMTEWSTSVTLGDNIDIHADNDNTAGPGFKSPSVAKGFLDTPDANADWQLKESSVLIDAGDDFLTEDILGVKRPQGEYSDIGAYEFVPIDYTPVAEQLKPVRNFEAYSSAGVVYLNAETNGTAEVYNLLGSRVKTVVVQQGQNHFDLPTSQIYIIRMNGFAQKILVR